MSFKLETNVVLNNSSCPDFNNFLYKIDLFLFKSPAVSKTQGSGCCL